MPLPKPRQGEDRDAFISRCMSNENVQNDSSNRDQALAMCFSLWDERSMNENQKLLEAIRSRGQKQTEFGYGIITADRYVKTMQDFVGTGICYDVAASRNTSWDDIVRKSSQTLVYGNQDMVVEERGMPGDMPHMGSTLLPDGPAALLPNWADALPKNTLMVFKHVLTTPKQDRDGDILRTEGAMVDPKMLLLWQHVHTLPIGKMLGVVEHTKDRLSLVSAIVDINELAHDAAVMIDNDMGRFSHGFRALEFAELSEEDADTKSGPLGFDIKRFEIMEESLVSVPSNIDAEHQEVLVSLVEDGKLTSAVMKEYGKTMRKRMPVMVAVTKEVPHEDESRGGSAAAKEEGRGEEPVLSSPEKAEADASETTETTSIPEVKAGRVISKSNLQVLKDVVSDLEELRASDELSRASMALCERCIRSLGDVIKSADADESEEDKQVELTAVEAMALFIAKANADELTHMETYLHTFRRSEEQTKKVLEYRSFIGI